MNSYVTVTFDSVSFPEISLMKWQFVVVTHAVPPSEVLAFLDSWITNTPVKMLCPQKKIACPYTFVKPLHA